MFDPLDEDQNKKENMTLDDSLLILANIYFFFRENDTNEVKGSYHDDCLEKNILHSCQYMMSICFYP